MFGFERRESISLYRIGIRKTNCGQTNIFGEIGCLNITNRCKSVAVIITPVFELLIDLSETDEEF